MNICDIALDVLACFFLPCFCIFDGFIVLYGGSEERRRRTVSLSNKSKVKSSRKGAETCVTLKFVTLSAKHACPGFDVLTRVDRYIGSVSSYCV